MSRGKMYVTRMSRHSRRKLPLWLYKIRCRLARWITPPYLDADIVVPFEENGMNICINDGETGRPLFSAVPIYHRRPAWSRWNGQNARPEAPSDPSV